MNNIIENINLLSNVISIVASTNNYRKIQIERLQKLYQSLPRDAVRNPRQA